jgi:hypothetical protein
LIEQANGVREELEVDAYSFVYAVGDNLEDWIKHLCYIQGESDFYRLSEIVNILDLWESQMIFTK